MRHEQLIHIDMNWNDEQTEGEQAARYADSKNKAEEIVGIIRDPSKGVHAEAVETVGGWAVEVVTNGLSCGEATFKRHVVAAGRRWHRNDVDEINGMNALIADGWSASDAQAVADRCHGRQPATQITDPRWQGV